MGLLQRILGRLRTSRSVDAERRDIEPTSESETVTLKITRLASSGRQAVAGEYYHRDQIAKFVGGRELAVVGDWEAGLMTPAYLHRDPKNRHDKNAVRVSLPHAGSTVLAGYLPSAVAAQWQPLLKRLEAVGRVAECCAAVYADRRGDAYQVVLRLSPPEDAEFANPEPDGATFLAADRECAVLGEQGFQEALEAYRDGPVNVWATLHPGVVPSGKYAGESTVEVRVDGTAVGYLAAAQGARYAEVLRYGRVVACEACVYEGPRHIEVKLKLPRVD